MLTLNRTAMMQLLGATLERDVARFAVDPTSAEARRAVDATMSAMVKTATMPADELNRIGAEVPVGGWIEALSSPVRALAKPHAV